MRNSKNKLYYLILLNVILCIVFYLALKYSSNIDKGDFFQINSLDNLVIDSNNPIVASSQFSYFQNDFTKDITPLTTLSHNIYIGSSSSENGLYFRNEVFNNNIFNLEKYNESNPYLLMKYKNDKVIFLTPSNIFTIGDQTVNTSERDYFTVDGVSNDKVIQINNTFINLSSYKNDFGINLKDLISSEITLYKYQGLNSENQLTFGAGLWDKKIIDCSEGASRKDILNDSLNLIETNGEQALLLSSLNKGACVTVTVPMEINKDSKYLFSFDYKNLHGGQLKWYFNFHNGNEWDIFEKQIFVGDNEWHHYDQVVPPTLNSIRSYTIYLYSNSANNFEVSNLFKNVRLSEYTFDKRVVLDKSGGTNYGVLGKVKLNNVIPKFTYNLNGNNLFDNNTLSFENGLWSGSDNDCSDRSRSELSTVKLSKSHYDGNYSLELSSDNGVACSRINLPVTINTEKTYRISFYYKNVSGGTLKYYYNFYNGVKWDTFEKTIIAKNNNWNYEEDTYTPKINNINSFSLYLYSPEANQRVVNLFDNIKVQEAGIVDMNKYILHRTNIVNNKINVKSIKQSKNNYIDVRGASNSFLLANTKPFSNKYKLMPIHPNNIFLLNIFKNPLVTEKYHYNVNNDTNVWWLDINKICLKKDLCTTNLDGSYNLGLEVVLVNQRWFYLGLIISGTTLAGCIGYLLYYWLFRRKRLPPKAVPVDDAHSSVQLPHKVRVRQL